MRTRIALTLLLWAVAASAQYAPTTNGASVAAGEINGKLNHQEGAGAPGSSYNCTLGKDVYTNSTNGDIYKCTTTGTPGAWTLFGATGPSGASGAGYAATSTTSLVTAGSGSKSFTTQSGLAYNVGSRMRATSAGTAEYMEGIVTSYSSTTLVATMDLNSGTGTHADWNISLAGNVGASGAGSGTVNSGTIGQVATYTGTGITLGGIGPGTTATVLHGNASGQPSYGAVNLATDVTGTTPVANGGTGQTSGTVTFTIASGAATLGTSAIAANTCATVVTAAAVGTATTDTISYTPNSDVSAITGYGTGSADGLVVYPYPTSSNVNFKVCNATGSSITPGGAIVLNWRVTR